MEIIVTVISRERFRAWVTSVFLGGLVSLWAMTDSVAGVNINIGAPDINISIGTPPPVVVARPPVMAVIPGTYVYIAPDISVEILFYHGHWYRAHNGHWFNAASYNGPWVYVASSKVPRAILTLPPGHRRLPPGHQRIPYEHVKSNWERWEREKHWQQDKVTRGGPERRGGDEWGRGNEGRGGHGGKRH